MASELQKQELVTQLMHDIGGEIVVDDNKEELVDTIDSILRSYNLTTDLAFVEKIATMKFPKGDTAIDMAQMPKELTEAAFLPVNTIADIALRQDLDMLISQIPEWYRALQIARDMICEADVVTGKIARSIDFDRRKLSEEESSSIISKIEEVEDRLDLHSIIKNQMVFGTLDYGEGYQYVIPYAKVFEDLYKYRIKQTDKTKKSAVGNMFETSSVLNGYGYNESTEVSLNDTVVINANTKNDGDDKTCNKKVKNCKIFTESEIMEIRPSYHNKPMNDESDDKKQTQEDSEFDEMVNDIADNIRYINSDIALPVIEESAHDLKCVYERKYYDKPEFIQEASNVFENVMESVIGVDNEFSRIHGVYQRMLPATKLIPIRIDREVIGYYYISDTTRPEESGERKNSGLSGYTLRSPSIGNDTFSPDRMMCEKLANKIINNFDLKFMRDNTGLHKQIVSILQAHKFNESMLRFVFIPAEHVIQTTINRDGMGKGHSMLEPGIVAGRMYMFLKLYCTLFQINNSQIRVINTRMSGIDQNYKQLIQETMRKFSNRRITANDIFNYRSSMTKVSGGSELIMPLGANDTPPITIDTIPAADSPLNTDFLESMKHEAINAQPVPSAMIMGAMSEIEFAKEVELGNTLLNSFIASTKIDLNKDISNYYRTILRYETDIDINILKGLNFTFRMATAKTLNVTVEMLQNFNAVADLAVANFLTMDEQKPDGENGGGDGAPHNELVRKYRQKLIGKYLPQIDVEELKLLADDARREFNESKLDKNDASAENIVDDASNDEMGGGF